LIGAVPGAVTVALALTVGFGACERGPEPVDPAPGPGAAPLTYELMAAPPCDKRTWRGEALAAQTTWTFDGEGQPLIEAEDLDGDGRLDRVLRHRYDGAGQRVETVTDDGDDGVADQRVTRVFDGQGRLLVEDVDRDADGVMDAARTFGYGGDDRLRWMAWDADGDGIEEVRRELAYDPQGRLVAEESFTLGAAEPDLVKTYTYDFHGWLVRTLETQRSADHQAAFVTLFEYDADGALTRERVDFGADGRIDQEIRYTWDVAAGLLAGETLDKGVDGQVDERITYGYTCWE
jgi:hypothetical protein